ncbi:hypothetical protein P7C70_g6426, partial [Phenoliferia sp. Uapishka_3]
SPLPSSLSHFGQPDEGHPPPLPTKVLSSGFEGLGILGEPSRINISPPMTPPTTTSSSSTGHAQAPYQNQSYSEPPPRNSSNCNGHSSPPISAPYTSRSPRDLRVHSSTSNGANLSPALSQRSGSGSRSRSRSPAFVTAVDAIMSPSTSFPTSSPEQSPILEKDSPLAEVASEEEEAKSRPLSHMQRQQELAIRIEQEKREREASDLARQTAETEARARWGRERDRLEGEERARLEKEELARREAGERLRREEVRRAEALVRAREREEEERRAQKEEKVRIEEEERVREEEGERRLIAEQERLEKKLRDEAEVRRKLEMKEQERGELVRRFAAAKKEGAVMLSGHVTVQGGASVVRSSAFAEIATLFWEH